MMSARKTCWGGAATIVSPRRRFECGLNSRLAQISAQIHDVHVGAEAWVVGEVPAGVVGVFVDDDVVGIPEPATHVGKVVRGDAPIPIVEAESIGTAAGEMPAMRRAEAAVPVAVLPGVVDVVVRVVGTAVVADPLVAVDVWGVGMARLVGVVAVFMLLRCGMLLWWCGVLLWWCGVLWCSVLWCGVLLGGAVIRLGSVRRRGVLLVAASGAAGVALRRGRMLLGKQREGEDGGDREI
jgi:hypothetical protein